MEVKDIIKKIRKSWKIVAYTTFLAMVVGIFLNFLPPKYIASGSLFVKRSIDQSENFFTYEGYYAQQSAVGFTDSVVAIIKSPDVLKALIEKMNIPLNNINYMKMVRSISTKKTGTQVILLTVKDGSYEKSQETWSQLNEILIAKLEDINVNGDNKLSVKTISPEPMVRQTYRNPLVFGLTGLIFGLSLGLILISIKEYLKR